jgi:subtilisin-like proprotein convertase family protein
VAPNGRVHQLRAVDKTDGTDDLKATWTFNGSASPRNGTWTLRITDAAKKDVGRLDSWTLKL